MASIGMKYPIYAPITDATDGQAITYGSGKIFAHAIAGTLTENRHDNPLYADDMKVENDKGMTDYSLSIEVDAIDIADRVALLGEVAVGTGTITHYSVVDANPAYVGFGFMRNLIRGGTNVYEAYWFHKVQFTQPSLTATTKRDQIEWGTTTLEGTGFGVNISAAGTIEYYDHMEFNTEALALAWLKNRANITTTTSTQ